MLGPLQRVQPARGDGLAFGAGHPGKRAIKRFGQRLPGIGNAEMQALRRQVTGAQQADLVQSVRGDGGAGYVGIADIHIRIVATDHGERGQRVRCADPARRGKPRTHAVAGHELALGDHAQPVQVRILRGARVIVATDHGQRCFRVRTGVDHAAGAVGGQRDIHHQVHFAAAGRLQHLAPTAVGPYLHAQTQSFGEQAQIVIAQALRLTRLQRLERRPAAVVNAQCDGSVLCKPFALAGRKRRGRRGLAGALRPHRHDGQNQQYQPADNRSTHAV
ncbi:hypothetical protein D3C81_1340820 [compost metagenome]